MKLCKTTFPLETKSKKGKIHQITRGILHAAQVAIGLIPSFLAGLRIFIRSVKCVYFCPSFVLYLVNMCVINLSGDQIDRQLSKGRANPLPPPFLSWLILIGKLSTKQHSETQFEKL